MKIAGSMEELQPLWIYCNCRQPSLPYICKKLIPRLQTMQHRLHFSIKECRQTDRELEKKKRKKALQKLPKTSVKLLVSNSNPNSQ